MRSIHALAPELACALGTMGRRSPDASREVTDRADDRSSDFRAKPLEGEATIQLRGLLEAAPDAILVVDADGRIIQVNAQAEQLFGYRREELIGRAHDDLLPERYRALHPTHRSDYFDKPAVRAMGMPTSAVMGLRKDGIEFPAEVSLGYLESRYGVLAIAFVRDSTKWMRAALALRQSEGRFRLALKNSPTMVYESDRELRYTWSYSSDRAFDPNTLLGKRDDEIAPLEDVSALIKLKEHVLRTGTAERREIPLRVAGDERVYDVSVEPVLVRSGEVTGLMVVATDITERAGTEREHAALLEREKIARKEAERAKRMRDEILAIVAHDLRNPLNGILLQATVFAKPSEEDAPGQVKDGARRIVDLALRMNALISDLLDAASIDEGRLRIVPQEQDVARIVSEAIETFTPLCRGRMLTLHGSAPDAPVRVSCDRNRIQQVLGNLVGNAMKFTPRGGAISVRAAALASEVWFSVSDTGEGIPTHACERIFDRYGNARERDVPGGLGLGLFIAKSIVAAHGGRMWVESKVGSGSTFFFTLPVLAPSEFS